MKKYHHILIHFGIWILYALIPALPVIFPDNPLEKIYYVYSAATIPSDILNFYLCYFFLSPVFFKKYKLSITLTITILFLFIYSWLRLYLVIELYKVYNVIDVEKINYFRGLIHEIVNTTIFSCLAIFISFTLDWFNSQKRKAELEKQNQASELALLRSQISPHFLFNTLNNIYSLVYQKSDDASSAVLKLSEIMRYMLYESNSDKVELEKEIDYLKSFIDLQSIRLRNKNLVDFKIVGNIEYKKIAPMLLIPFVENAFKHGSKSSNQTCISINLKINQSSIEFEVKNMIETIDKNMAVDSTKGIGLQNLKRRLELIYPGKFMFETVKLEREFIAKLKIEECE